MRIAISGTYSSGKTTTSIALAHLTGIPRTHAKTMREILPEVLPGRRLEDCTGSELVQLGIIRYAERAVHESHMGESFISDGSSIHEWVYGKIRTRVGIHPGLEPKMAVELSEEMRYFEQIMDAIGAVTKRHAKNAYDVFVHLPIEFGLVADGHRPVSESFRRMSDELLIETLTDLDIPYHVIGGTLTDRLEQIARVLDLPRVIPLAGAIALAQAEIASADNTDELHR